ncbi:MAG TPA: hypothetical protein VFY96_12295 [Candidatus Binatia bacterium]|nr:hypothetical protein [Candidatus Binatia bacterium]
MELKKQGESKMDLEKAKLNPAAVFKPLKKSFQAKNCRANKNLKSFGDGNQDGMSMEVGEEEGMPGPQPKLLQRFATLCSPRLLAGYRALEPQQSDYFGPCDERPSKR